MINNDNIGLIKLDHKDVIINLPDVQAKALEMLVQNIPVKDVASQIGMSERSVYRWMTKEPFKSTLDKTKEVVVSDLSALATERLTEMLCSDNLYAQQFAISQWVKMQKDTVKVEVDDTPKFNTLEQLMASIKR